jgi:hypothetical protein
MANSSLILSSLDFDTQKANFKEFLKTQSVFKDYNFEGSNMNVLLDVMSYNTYLNSFYLNMIASEMFLDSAQKYDSVISHAKELNYVPRSAASSVANVSFIAVDSTNQLLGKLIIPKGTRFFGYNSNSSFNFVTKETTTFLSSNTTYNVNNLQIFEGAYFQDSFVVNYDIENQRYVLSNQNVDSSSISVSVLENNAANTTVFTKADNLFGLDSTSEVFFLQGCENNKYELIFGDGLFGRKPLNAATIIVNYIVTNGSAGNGVEGFTITDTLGTGNNPIIIDEVVTLTSSTNGADQENIENVRYNAPRYFATQQRAVASDDYASLIKAQFGGNVDDVIIYGGQELEPKQYGRVIVCIKPADATIVPDYLKDQISNYLLEYIALPNRIIISEPDYFYIEIDSTVQYNKNITTKSSSDIRNNIIAEMLQFSADHVEKFGNDFRYSKFVSHIDDTDTSITSNNTKIKMIKRLAPKLNYATSYTIDFANSPEKEGIYGGVVYPDEKVLSSSIFTYVDSSGVSYENCYMEDMPDAANPDFGYINIYNTVKNVKILVKNAIGHICYADNAKGPAGRVILNSFITSGYSNYISIYMVPNEKDIIATKNMVLLMDAADITCIVKDMVK